MGKIIAIGGGEIGRPHEDGGSYPIETKSIDREIIKQTERKIQSYFLLELLVMIPRVILML